jgi:hypothetical protein
MSKNQKSVDSHRLVRLAKKMRDKDYRDGYVAAHTRLVLAKQMREFRGTMPQTEFAALLDKRQTVVSRLENPNYAGWTVSTLLEIASKLNVAVFVRFVDFSTFLKYSGDQSETALRPEEYNQQRVDDFACIEAQHTFAVDDVVAQSMDVVRRPADKKLDGEWAAREAQAEIVRRGSFGSELRGNTLPDWSAQNTPTTQINPQVAMV